MPSIGAMMTVVDQRERGVLVCGVGGGVLDAVLREKVGVLESAPSSRRAFLGWVHAESEDSARSPIGIRMGRIGDIRGDGRGLSVWDTLSFE